MADTYACGITVERPTEDLYGLLGLEPSASTDDIDAAAQDIMVNGSLTPSQRYAWKALMDPAYRAVYDASKDTHALYQAGFFDDGLPRLATNYAAADDGLLTTPLNKARANLSAGGVGDPVILVTTGGMAPIHQGHVAMMDAARAILEGQGKRVIAGYFAPGHDSYVGKKYGGTAAIPAGHRCAMVELACRGSDWLDLDPWAARYMPAEVNFTDVVARLQNYVWWHLGRDVEVHYVYGSDNQGFGAALPDRSVMVERTAVSSKLAREGDHSFLDDAVRDYLVGWRSPSVSREPYLIRGEEDEAIMDWEAAFGGQLTTRRVQLQSAVRLGIAGLFRSEGLDNKVHLMSVVDQRARAREVIGDRRVLSLDPFFEGEARLDSTRYFELSGPQFSPLFRAERMGRPTLGQQAQMIQPGDYVLVEDDTVTGGTIAAALSHLPSGVRITDQVILSDFSAHQGTSYMDVVDLRDFIMGSQHGGLSVILPNGAKARAPYVMPFVSLRSRAKIPAEVEVDLSRIIWQSNVKFFKDTGVKIQDCDPGFQELAKFAGWSVGDEVEGFCRFYAEALLESA